MRATSSGRMEDVKRVTLSEEEEEEEEEETHRGEELLSDIKNEGW